MKADRHQSSDLHEEIVRDLQEVIRGGLPLRMVARRSAAMNLPGVSARAANSDDPSSLTAALEGVMRLQLARLEDRATREAAQLLFGADRGSTGKLLTDRRQLAAAASGYEVHHFRKRVEPRILAAVASALIADSESYNQTRVTAPSLIVHTRRPRQLPQDVWAWEAVEHQETLLRIWAAIYGLKADLLAGERLASMGAPAEEIRTTADRALVATGMLLKLSADYRSAYGERLVQSESEIKPEDFLSLAGWTPALTAPDQRLLCDLATQHGERDLLNALQAQEQGRRVVLHWRRELCERPSEGA